MRDLILARAIFAALLVFIGLTNTANAELFEIYVSIDGSDHNSGTTWEQATRRLARALQIAERHAPAGNDIVIYFGPGDYRDEKLEVNWFPGGTRRLVLIGQTDLGHARFDGGNGNSTWLVVRGKRGERTNVSVRGFDVMNYRGAIAFYGDRFDEIAWSAGNRLERNYFSNIGQFRPEVKPAFAAITLTNSRDNVISGNVFRNIRNLQKCDGLHAIYLSGGSSDNLIADNIFDGGCGDTIKVRDRSNNNEIIRNIFMDQTGKSILIDSFCDRRKILECSTKPQECPSWGNQFFENKTDDASLKSVKTLTRTVGTARIPGCPTPLGSPTRILVRP